MEALKRMTAWFDPSQPSQFEEIKLSPGQFYPRMARPINVDPKNGLGFSPSANNAGDIIALTRGS
jgi:hypothetical protein